MQTLPTQAIGKCVWCSKSKFEAVRGINKAILFVCALLVFSLACNDLKAHSEKLQNVQTPEDMKRLGWFSAMFEMAQKREKPAGEIPKILHFIWLGPSPFPASSIAHVKGWIDKHSGWKVEFWTDLGQNAPDDRMEMRVFDKFPLEELKEFYYKCDNYGERSQILRYAVLINEGGVYVDHDVVCIKAIDPLQGAYDFFCGMEPLGPTVLSSSVNPSPHLLASTAQHPILKATRKWLVAEWDRLQMQYPGVDSSSVYNRTQRRTFRALWVGIKEAYARAGRKDVVFPPDYFSLSQEKSALFASHQHRGSWYKKQESGDLKSARLLSEAQQELTRTLRLCLVLTAVNMSIGVFLIAKFFRLQRSGRKA
jgi:mannosyltransferase OCH1-like enzyme